MAPKMIGIQRPGGYADHLIVPHPRYLIDASGIDPVWAATLSCSGLSTYSAVSKLKPIPRDEWVAVIGAGGLGLSAIGMLRALGHERIVSIDIDAAKLNAASAAGAAATLDSRDEDALQRLKEITDGALCGAVDFVGSAETALLALGGLRKGGRLVLVGLFGGEIKLSIASTILRAISVQGSHLGSVAELNAVVALAREGKIKPIPIETRPLSEVSRTLDELKAGTVIGRVVAVSLLTLRIVVVTGSRIGNSEWQMNPKNISWRYHHSRRRGDADDHHGGAPGAGTVRFSDQRIDGGEYCRD